MTFSAIVAQQREQQERALRRFMTYSLTGSFVLHGIGLCLNVNSFWSPEVVESDEIVIVVAEPSVEPPVERSLEEPVLDPIPEPETSVRSDAPIVSADISAAPIEPDASLPLPVSEPEPLEETDPPLEEDLLEEEPINEEPRVEQSEAPEVEEAVPSTTAVEESSEPRPLSDLLQELRRAREQTDQPATGNPTGQRAPSDRPTSNNQPGTGREGDAPTAAQPTQPGIPAPPSPESGGETNGGDRSEGSRSREISCQGCDFDYPENADGAEGTAQVIVETDDQGRVISVTLSGSSGNPELDRAALDQARERVRLDGARAGESYPIEIDFVQPNSDAAERAEERGDRRRITVSEPEPVSEPAADAATPSAPGTAPASESQPSPTEQPFPPSDPNPSPSTDPAPSPATDEPEAVSPESPSLEPSAGEESELAPLPSAETAEPDSLPVPESIPESIPESVPDVIPSESEAISEPSFGPEVESEPVPEPDFAPEPEPIESEPFPVPAAP